MPPGKAPGSPVLKETTEVVLVLALVLVLITLTALLIVFGPVFI
jgi:hypothetical protein